jgi:hypothetical protein
LALARVGEYAQAVRALAPNTLMAPSIETIVALYHLHPMAEVDLFPFVDDFHPKMNIVLDIETFIYVLTCFPRFSSSGPLGMVYELLHGCFVFNNSTSGFDILFELCGHIFCGHVPPLVSCLLVALRLLALEKQAIGIHPIAIGEVIYQLVARTLIIQFKDTFAKHFSHTSLGWQH